MTADGGVRAEQPTEPPRAEGRSHPLARTDWILGSLIGLRALYGLVLFLLVPVLIGPHPLLLELLSGSTISEVVVGARVRIGEIAWPWAVLAGVPLWVLTDWIYWWAGRRWGDRALQRLMSRGGAARARRRAARVEQVIDRFGAWGVLVAKFLPLPAQLVYAAAGTAGMRLPVFVALNALGTTASVAVVVSLGYALGQRAVDLVERLQRYGLLATVVLVVVVAVAAVVRHRRRAARAGGGA